MTKTKPALGALVILALVYGTLALVQGGGEGVGESVRKRPIELNRTTSPAVPADYLPYQEYVQKLAADAAEADRVAAEAQQAAEEAARGPVPQREQTFVQGPPVASGGTCEGDFPVSGSVVYRESRCDPNAYNATGCGGRGCVGLFQLDQGHFAQVSPWNSGTSGTCADLSPASQADQKTCAARLPASAWAG